MATIQKESISLTDAPAIPGLAFRGFAGESDYPKMLAVIDGSKAFDGTERSETLEEMARNYSHLTNCDPYTDMLFAEINGEVVGYNRVFWETLDDGTRTYILFGFLLPDWRRKGLGAAMLRHAEARLRQIAATHPEPGERYFQSFAEDTETCALALLESQGYTPARYGLSMVRDLSEPFPDAPMPAGLEVRPVTEAHLPAIHAAFAEAFRDHWGFHEEPLENFLRWAEEPTYMPQLWKIAWAGDEVAGTVLNFFNEAENIEYGRKRGLTETISVRRPWRKMGLARALLVQSMKMFKEMGMTETALRVDAENLSGALKLYQSVGYKEVKRHITFRKPL
ncbi:MAG: GNAT family N-acetyltransferase [Chloroflexi bacterium]|nr:MAG: GNAT family N-acetyltransferase [Chloroflexota bacterium]